jgi:hypothetical protein
LETAEALRQSGSLRVARIAKKSAQDARPFSSQDIYFPISSLRANSNAWLACWCFLPVSTRLDHIPDLPPPEEFALEPVPAVLSPRAALPEVDLPVPPLNPVGLEPLLDPVVPLPGLRLVGFDPLLEPVPVAGLALPAGGTLPGAMPGAT